MASVQRAAPGAPGPTVIVTTETGAEEGFDAVLFATHSDITVRHGPTDKTDTPVSLSLSYQLKVSQPRQSPHGSPAFRRDKCAVEFNMKEIREGEEEGGLPMHASSHQFTNSRPTMHVRANSYTVFCLFSLSCASWGKGPPRQRRRCWVPSRTVRTTSICTAVGGVQGDKG